MEKKNILVFTIIGVAIIIVIALLFIINPFSADPRSAQQNKITEPAQPDSMQQTQQMVEEQQATAPTNNSTNKTKPKTLAVSDDVHVVSEGETLKSIARDVLGDEKMWFNLFLANEGSIDWYDTIYVGQKLKLPKVN